MDNKQEAQKRADQIQSFYDEVKLLESDQVLQLGADQREAVARYHERLLATLTEKFDIDTTSRQKQLSAGMKIASFIGALALAASVFFLFYQFWGYFTTPVQVSLLISAPLLTMLLTWWVSRREATG